MPIAYSILDLAPINQGGDAAQSFRNTLDLARHAERWGYRRYWLAEHHATPGIASAATAVLIAHVAAGTRTIRVGAGGVMLPNHSPLVIAEQFGTLECLHPDRIDLGLGRAPGTDARTVRALRRNLASSAEQFPQDVQELADYFAGSPRQPIRAVPGAGLRVPLWILGTSLYGAQVAAALGLPYAFASHFAPAQLMQAIATYRSLFRPSTQLSNPYVMVSYSVFAADTFAQARYWASSMHQEAINFFNGQLTPLPPPVEGYFDRLTPGQKAAIEEVRACSAIGTLSSVRTALRTFLDLTGADEIIIPSQIFDHAARLRSYEIVAEALSGTADAR